MVGYAHIALPLTGQLKKDKFGWNEEADVAFQKLKQAMTILWVLVMPDFTQLFIVEIDAFGFGWGQ